MTCQLNPRQLEMQLSAQNLNIIASFIAAKKWKQPQNYYVLGIHYLQGSILWRQTNSLISFGGQ